jgi:tRNA(Ile)-lysidine synthase
MPNDPRASLRLFLQSPALRRTPKRLLVAVSGGADSVALLLAAAEVGGQLGWQVHALHCEHGLRGKASKADEAFVARLCARHGVPLHRFHTKLRKGAGMEQRARAWRQRCYALAAGREDTRLVLLGHHAQDQAETLLLNLVRGTGAKGAAGMLPLSPLEDAPGVQLGRPWLEQSPADLRALLKANHQAWREDASNRNTDLVRNRLRHRVLPQLLAINPKALEHLAAFITRLRPAKADRGLADLLKLDAAARGRAQAVLAKGRGKADLGRGWTLEMGQGKGRVARREAAVPLTVGGQVVWGADWSFTLKPGVPDARKLKQDNAYWFAPALLEQAPCLRAALPGEKMRPFGLRGSKLLRDLLAEAKVPAWQRADWPVLEAGGQAVALPGVRRGQEMTVLPGQKAFCLAWQTSVKR